jgi:hypothetical protein
MSDPARFSEIGEMARRMKLDVVHKYGDHPDESFADLPNVVSVFRDDKPVILVYPEGDSEAVRQCVYWAAALLRADALYLVADARFRRMPEGTTPEEAQANEPHAGDFQRDWEAGRRDGLAECLLVHRLPALGPSELVTFPYVREGRKLTWLESSHMERELGGAVPDYARQGFNDARDKARMMQEAADEMAVLFDVPPEDRLDTIDRALARFITTKEGVGRVVLLAQGLAEFEDGEAL